jgi:hypothetical protein
MTIAVAVFKLSNRAILIRNGRKSRTARADEGKNMAGEKCDSVFDGNYCEKTKGHKGKHLSSCGPNGEVQHVQWSDAGLNQWLKEQEKS